MTTIELPNARHLSDEALAVLRPRALRAIQLGYGETDVADLLGLRHETVCRWWTAFQAGGLDGLPGGRTGRPLGSGRRLTEEQARRVRSFIDAGPPEQCGLPHALWTRRAVGDLVRRDFGIDLADRTVGTYLRRWGYTPKKPSRRARDQDPDEVEQWLLDTYPAIEAQAERENADILWTDEVGVQADHHPGTGYARVGEPATMDVPKPHIRVNQIAAIGTDGTVRFMTYQGGFNAVLFLTFLTRLIAGASRKIL